jgi:hypothetical protein
MAVSTEYSICVIITWEMDTLTDSAYLKLSGWPISWQIELLRFRNRTLFQPQQASPTKISMLILVEFFGRGCLED